MNNDAKIKDDVLNELDWESSIDATNVGVTVKDGIVTLSGHVSTFSQKHSAEKAAKNVTGVKGVVQEMDVKLLGSDKRTDQDIIQSALNNLKWNTNVPENDIKLKVENGWITIDGKVNWNFQKTAAKNCVKDLSGVRGVTNLIQIITNVEPSDIKQKIKNVFERNASLDADNININVDGHTVKLYGTVQSWAEKKQAEKAVWSSQGVTKVENNLEIKFLQPAL